MVIDEIHIHDNIGSNSGTAGRPNLDEYSLKTPVGKSINKHLTKRWC